MYSTLYTRKVFKSRFIGFHNTHTVSEDAFTKYSASLLLDIRLAFPTSMKTAVKFKSQISLFGTEPRDFFFGGAKASMDAPPNYWSKPVQSINHRPPI
jgi:hypothetical protein